ncbi:MAG: 1-aminocyclopropane-1-carboxylate deaminase/D-cysteine desulfhydrase [Arcicella sp.]|nr:1-aminocyclopropane-1-carboxylate deaminase/D-cysteine desulfhydrase [Arcicella sp.]
MIQLPPSPLQLIDDPLLKDFPVKLYIKRDDLIHPEITGNKWRKLKYNLIEAREKGFKSLMTFGGAFSNHIYATSAAGKEFGFKTTGIIRGEELTATSNEILMFSKINGMDLIFLPRLNYGFKDKITRQYKDDFYVIPEGGSNEFAIKGVVEMMDEIYAEITPDVVCVAAGTGGTLAGIITGLRGETKALGFAVLKDKGLMYNFVSKLLTVEKEFNIINDYIFGNYGKTTLELIKFIIEFEKRNPSIKLEQVYTGKMMFGVYDMIQKGKFKEGTTICVIHTGGLRGRMKQLGEIF